ncbi:beta-phosphoglucomutase [Hathewaya histolytica]|uniref:Beta-phosphoglucomutase n=1 Tax=Hathewaya histolytica TaxID=1498 RepID=A0A4U9S3K5_HATHI|nr:beta-phosphoglucomutase [Hathewaya histolytica]VTQ96250.1 Beta-phosphoglucomutase [Hathewaya histolytica]
MTIKGVIFDLDGVIVTTDNYHYEAWKKLADEEDIYFDRDINERLRGVSRMESLNILLEKATCDYSDNQKKELSERKNNYYKELIKNLNNNAILPGVIDIIQGLKQKGIKIAIGSSSKNTPAILNYIGLGNCFDAIVDGNQIKNSKPDPEVFLKAAHKLNLKPNECVVIEDAVSGVEAGLKGGMKVIAVGFAAKCSSNATLRGEDLTLFSAGEVINI